jgi:hypothetical protein
MIVNVTETFRVNIDTYGNHQPEFFKPSSLIEKGKNAGEMSEPKWVSAGKYYRNVAQAIWWGIENGYLGEDNVADEQSLKQHLDTLEARISLLTSLLNSIQSK